MSEPGAITVQSAVAFLLATWPRRIALALILLVPVVVGATGGFARAEPPPRTVEVGVATDTGAYLVVPRYYFVSDNVDAGSLDEGERWLGVVVELTNQGDEPIYLTFGDETFRIPAELLGPDDLAGAYEALRLDTGNSLGEAQPGLTYEVALLWRTTAMADPPDELTLTMFRTRWIEWNIEAGYRTWRATDDSSYVTLPLGDPPRVILEEEDE